MKTSADPPFNSEITLNGEETGVRFVSMPFNVVVREGNITWTLGGGGGNENASEAVTSAVGFTISAGSAPTATAIGTAAVKSGGAGGKSSAGNRSSWTAIYSVALLWPVVIIAYAL